MFFLQGPQLFFSAVLQCIIYNLKPTSGTIRIDGSLGGLEVATIIIRNSSRI